MRRKENTNSFFIGDIYSKIIIIVCVVTALFTQHYIFALILGAALFVSFFLGELSYRREISSMQNHLENAAIHIESSECMRGFPFPALSITDKGKITWYNCEMDKLMQGALLFQKDIHEFVKSFDISAVGEDGIYPTYETKIENRTFMVYAHSLPAADDAANLISVYFIDCTEFAQLKKLCHNTAFVEMTISFDNFEEVMQGLDDNIRIDIQTALDRCLTNMATETNGILKKTERDRYTLLINKEALSQLENKKFPILDAAREISVGNKIAPTISIGVGVDGTTFSETDSFSRTALDMALGRGGDQVVVKNGTTLQYYGGKTREVEKRTKVKARVVAYALRELIHHSDAVFILGHKNADIDCIGGAMGVVAICRCLGKKAYIIQHDFDDTASAVMKEAQAIPQYQNVFVKMSMVEDLLTPKSMLVIVDTNSPSYMYGTDLLGSTEQIVLIDHHRRSSDSIKNPTLAYHEPYASSTCEMITEMLTYLDEKNMLLKVEAEALYAGIYLDTKCFTFKTGVRTLEAAAYLRRAGIDPITVKQFFKNNLDTFTQKASLIQGAEIVLNHVAISITDEKRSPSVIAQAADELLNIVGIDTSFVIAKGEGCTVVSGRSTGNINVQVVLEKLGGGGHFSVAGAQVKDLTPEETAEEIISILKEFDEEK